MELLRKLTSTGRTGILKALDPSDRAFGHPSQPSSLQAPAVSPRQKIGSQLVSEGLIQPDHLQAALKAQLQFRGRLGSNLIELGFIAVDDVSLALGRQLGVRAATRADFVELNASLLKRLPARAANMYSAIPMRAAGSAKTVVVAMMDPTNLVALDELQTILGARVEALVAPELRIVHLLDKLYGVKRKQRTFIRMVLDRPVRSHVEASAPNTR